MQNLEGWDTLSKQPTSAEGQKLLFEQGDRLSPAVRKSLDQGQLLLWETPSIAPAPDPATCTLAQAQEYAKSRGHIINRRGSISYWLKRATEGDQ